VCLIVVVYSLLGISIRASADFWCSFFRASQECKEFMRQYARRYSSTAIHPEQPSGCIFLQELAKTADHVASRTFYLWRVNVTQVCEHALDEMYHGASNLRNRLQHELAQEKEVS
jgi:hypothetical protein